MALGEINSGNESASELKRLSDTRNVATKPSDYYGKFVLTGIKYYTALGLPYSGSAGYGYYNVIGFDGWNDASGPRAIEIAFGSGNGIYIRSAANANSADNSVWDSWYKVTTTAV